MRSRSAPGQSPVTVAVALAAVFLYAAIPYLSFARGPEAEVGIPAVGLVLLLGIDLLRGRTAALPLLWLAALMAIWEWAAFWPRHWPFRPLMPLGVYGLLFWRMPSLRRSAGWLRAGRFDQKVWWLFGITAVGSSGALFAWYWLLEPDLSPFLASIPDWSPVLLALAGLGFALLNAAVEEAIFRGVFMQALEESLGPGWSALFAQAVAFGVSHFAGIPKGWSGVGMATLCGGMLGVIRRCSGGLLAPFLAHVVADVAIFLLLVCWVRT